MQGPDMRNRQGYAGALVRAGGRGVFREMTKNTVFAKQRVAAVELKNGTLGWVDNEFNLAGEAHQEGVK